ncbi:MAG: histone deacetylase family protein [Deltaproteobacteria bacterium]|nr:histone deacetylase family protein [Deltaproteobacteria bacterium]
MKVIFHEDFYQVYTHDPAAEEGRMEAIVNTIQSRVEFVTAVPATQDQISAVHTQHHIEHVRHKGPYSMAALAAGGAVQAATLGLTEPCFGLIRPPGHHASADSCWGFCYFNNMAIALESLKQKNKIQQAYVLDIDLHYGDGNVNILSSKDYVTVCNINSFNRFAYVDRVTREMENCEDYQSIGQQVKAAADRNGGGCFAILEGGYNHNVLGENVMALIDGLSG